MKTRYEDLANAIIIQAVKDIRLRNKYERSARRFLKSEWCRILSQVDGRTILRKLDEEIANKRKGKQVAEVLR